MFTPLYTVFLVQTPQYLEHCSSSK